MGLGYFYQLSNLIRPHGKVSLGSVSFALGNVDDSDQNTWYVTECNLKVIF